MFPSGPCQHEDSERDLVGCWATPELELAVSHGYTIITISEAWQWDLSTTELFKPMMAHFYRKKLMVS